MFKVKISRKYQMLAFSIKLLNNIFFTHVNTKKVVIGGKNVVSCRFVCHLMSFDQVTIITYSQKLL